MAKSANSTSDKVVISSEYYTGEDRPSYICSYCNQTLIRLTDAGMNNTAFWCSHCSIEFDSETENIRKESKIVVPDRNIEPAITSVGNVLDVSIRHEPSLKDGFAQLAKKGTIRFTSYEER